MHQNTEPGSAIIIGAGPAGALLAWLLARMGVRVTLIERHADFAREFRGEGMTPGGVGTIRLADLIDEFSKLPHSKIGEMRIFSNGKRFLRVDMRAVMPPGLEFMRLQPQEHLLELLVGKCAGFANFTLLRGTVVRDLLMQDGRVTGILAGTEAGDREIQADYVIAADGRYSLARRKLNLDLQGETQAFDVVWCKIPRPSNIPLGTVYGFLVETLFGLAFPAEDDHMQIGRIIPKGSYRAFKGQGPDAWKDHLQSALPPELATGFAEVRDRASDPTLLDVECGALEKWSVPGLCFIGDAAHPMSPVGAQGINVALRDSIVAANHFGPLLLNSAEAAAFDHAATNFETERRIEVDRLQAQQSGATQQLKMMKFIAPIIRLVPDSWINAAFAWYLRGSGVKSFTQGVTKVELLFKPESAR